MHILISNILIKLRPVAYILSNTIVGSTLFVCFPTVLPLQVKYDEHTFGIYFAQLANDD
jgi:hypothetical protein